MVNRAVAQHTRSAFDVSTDDFRTDWLGRQLVRRTENHQRFCPDGGRNVRYSFNRKEEKDHGEGGNVVGAPLAGRVLIIDDVISAGTSVRESIAMIAAAGGRSEERRVGKEC